MLGVFFMLQTQLRILRVFGPTSSEVMGVLRTAQAEGCPGLRLLERDGEFAICVQASAPTQAMAESYCEKWSQKLAARFGDTLYATGEVSLAQAALDAMLKKRRLLVAADEPTGRLVGGLLQPLEHSEAVFDFGTQTYANPENARKIVTPAAISKKFPGDILQSAAARAQLALTVGGADYAVAYIPATVGQAPAVMLCDKKGAMACAVSPELSDAAIGNHLLDLVRRRALGIRPSSDTVAFRPGHDTPMLIVSKAGQLSPLSDTLRFSLRRPRTAHAARGNKAPDFEPMLDFDHTAEMPRVTAPAPGYTAVEPAPQAARAAGGDAASARQTAWPRAGAARAARAVQPEPAQATGQIVFEEDAAQAQPAEKPDFSAAGAGFVPPPAYAQPQDGASGADAAPERRAAPPAHSILDEEVPEFRTPAPDAGGPDDFGIPPARDAGIPRRPEEFRAAAHHLFDPNSPDDVANPMKNRSLAVIEKSERRQRRTLIAFALVLGVLLLAGAAGLYWYFRTDIGAKPSATGYGTAAFDEKANAYLAAAAKKQTDVAGYLAFPGAEGELVYTAEQPRTGEKAAFGGELIGAAATAENAVRPVLRQNRLQSAGASNTLLDCGGNSLAGMADMNILQRNAGFTLYTAEGAYRYKILSVFYWDPQEKGSGAFTALSQGEYPTYAEYLALVTGLRARSLVDTGVTASDGAQFLTLYAGSGADSVSLCVTGRRIGEGENAQLSGSAITRRDDPLLTAAQYAAKGTQMPDVSQKLADAMAWYTGLTLPAKSAESAAEPAATADAAGADSLVEQAASMAANTQAVLASADKLLAGLTDVAGKSNAVETTIAQGVEGGVPSQAVAVTQLSAAATASPTASPTPAVQAASDQPAATAAPTAAAVPEPVFAGSAEGETINVTMNGSQQTLDLVRCLAMIAQNELGANAPAEAYKAQCVAAHCWIVSQGGYPSVAGQEPGAAALAAAQEVAHVLVSVNGSVCFTPYFAAASTGTASAADVWGNSIAWLQAVDSPYDKDTASNWNTNGASTGCARFSRQALAARIQELLGIDLSGADPNGWFKILSANQYGWVAQMQIGPDDGANTTCSGRWFREKLTAGQSVDGRSLRSQCFTFTYDAGLDCFLFDVYGYGHGCGMSQWGAVGYANNGWDYRAILGHYFPGTSLTAY